MSSFERQAILDCLSRLVTPGIKLTALADDLGVRKQDYSELRSQILQLVEEGIIVVLPGGAFALAPSGRPVDPHAKPLPPVPPERPPAERKARPAKQVRAKKPQLPWTPPKPATEYDPDTGEVREGGQIRRTEVRTPKSQASTPRPG